MEGHLRALLELFRRHLGGKEPDDFELRVHHREVQRVVTAFQRVLLAAVA